MNSTLAAVLALGAVGFLYFRSQAGGQPVDTTGTARNDAAGPRLPSMPAMPDMPSLPGFPSMPSGATPNAPRLSPDYARIGPQPGSFLGGGLWG